MNASNSTLVRRIATILTLGLLMIAVFATANAQEESSLRIGINVPEDNLDPALASSDSAVLLNRHIYDYLVEVTPAGEIEPNLATDWTISDDGLTYTFTLVENATFHDGTPFTAQDVVFTFNRLEELESAAIGLLGDFEVQAEDDHTVVFTLAGVNADFLYGVGSRFALILKDGTTTPNQIAEGENPYASFNGTGPFRLSDYRQGESATLVRNDAYWREGQPLLDSLVFVYNNDPIGQINQILDNQVDVIFRVPLDELVRLEQNPDISILQEVTNQHPLIRLRADEGFLGEDVRIRQAFKLATDREELNDVFLNGLGTVGNNDPIGPKYAQFYNDAIEDPGYQPEAACELIQQTGVDRLSVQLYVVQDAFLYEERLAPVLQQQWEQGCIDVTEILGRPESVYYGENEWLEVELGITPWADRPVPQEYLATSYHSEGVWNEAHWSNAELDDLIQQASQAVDAEERAAIYARISEIFAEEGPVIIPFFSPIVAAVRADVSGIEMNPFPGLTDFRQVSVNG